MNPQVIYLIVCDRVEPDPVNPLRLNVNGLSSHIRSTSFPPFPIRQASLCILIILTNCQGAADLSVRIVRDSDGAAVHRGTPRRIRFSGHPDDEVGATIRIANCWFPDEGLYWVELIWSGRPIDRQALFLKS
jgi:hypothetical protein